MDPKDQPFTAPTVIPFTKYFCANGNTQVIGITVNTVMTILAVLAGSWILESADVASLPETRKVIFAIML